MKKLTLFVLAMGLVFGAFAQKLDVKSSASFQGGVKASTMGVTKYVKADNAVKTSTATASYSYADMDVDGITTTITLTPSSDVVSFAMQTFSNGQLSGYISQLPMTLQDGTVLATAGDIFNYLQIAFESYAGSGAATKDVQYQLGNTTYELGILLCDGTDTTVLVEQYTTPSAQRSGTAELGIDVHDITAEGFVLTATFNDQTYMGYAGIWVLEDLNSALAQVGLDATINSAADWSNFVATDENGLTTQIANNGIGQEGDYNVQATMTEATSAVLALAINANGEFGNASFVAFNINGYIGSSLNEIEDANISIFPNPTTDRINIQSNTLINSVEIYNTLGQRVYNMNSNVNGLSINSQNFDKGTYIVKVRTNGKVATSKVVVR